MKTEHEKILFSQILRLVKTNESLLSKIDSMKRDLNEVKKYVNSLEIINENASSVKFNNHSEPGKRKNPFTGKGNSPLYDILSTVEPLEEHESKGNRSILESDGMEAHTPEAQAVLNKIQGMFKGQ